MHKTSVVTVVGEVGDESAAQLDVFSRLCRERTGGGRGDDLDDSILVVSASIPGGTSVCSRAAALCQDAYSNRVQGDPAADPLDCCAGRRLEHCAGMKVTSLARLTNDDDDGESVADVSAMTLPDDMAIYAKRRTAGVFDGGSYLRRRSGLRENGLTTAYCEINGAADGHLGWIVDRYDKWLFVQHHDGGAIRGGGGGGQRGPMGP